MKNYRKTPKSKVLMFKNLMSSPEEKGFQRGFSCGTHYLASALKKRKIPFSFSDSRIVSGPGNFINDQKSLVELLKKDPKINLILLSLSELYFDKAKYLLKILRKESQAFICLGGPMPTLSPEAIFINLPEADILVRGVGEYVVGEIASVLKGKNRETGLQKEDLHKLSLLPGVCLAAQPKDAKINFVDDYDKSYLDFSFFKKKDLREGLFLFTAWGCFNNCSFCTGFSQGKFRAKSLENIQEILKNYQRKLKNIYRDIIPKEAFLLSFYDDDFLGDPDRAISFFKYIKNTPFKINFFQTGINSFFIRKDNKYSDNLNKNLLESFSQDIFDYQKPVNVYIGLENLSDRELKLLNKGYTSQKAKKVIAALAKKKVKAAYHFIVSNQETKLEDILINLITIASLQKKHGNYFKILTPVVPYLVSLYCSASYRNIARRGQERFLKAQKILQLPGPGEKEYPLIKQDIPINKLVSRSVPYLVKLFNSEKNYLQVAREYIIYLLYLKEKVPEFKTEIELLLKKYWNAYIGVASSPPVYSKSSLQLMLTRRCHLRCKYCPVLKKKEDMSLEVISKTINFLFTSSQRELRLDFTGGEPLLRFDLVKAAVKKARRLAIVKKKKISFYMVTNLIALTDEIADFLAKENFLLELSLDGQEMLHNLYKVGEKKNINPYQATTSHLPKILERKINNYAVMVVGVSTVGYLYRNFCHLLSLGVKNIGINYALCSYWPEAKQKEFFYQLELVRKGFSGSIKRGVITLGNLESRQEPAILNSEIMINCDGSVNFLSDWLFEREKKKKIPALGNIGNLKSIDKIFVDNVVILRRLIDNHNNKQKDVILNNIEMGEKVKRYFSLWKKELKR